MVCVCVCVYEKERVCARARVGCGRRAGRAGPPPHPRAPVTRHLRDVGRVEEADEVAQQRGSVAEHQVHRDDADDSCNGPHQKLRHALLVREHAVHTTRHRQHRQTVIMTTAGFFSSYSS